VRVLITGAAGFIGSHLAERFEEKGDQVYGVDNLETGQLMNYIWGEPGCDIAKRELFYRLANKAKPELVIHCAASYSDPNKWHRDVDTNVTGTINATLVAKHHDCPIVYFQTALPPVSSYAISKIAGQQYIEQSGVPYLIFRLANIYGPRNLSGPIPTFYKRLKNGEPCTVVDTKRDMVYIEDLLRCVSQALEGDAEGCYDVCSGQKTTIRELYNAVAANFEDAPDAEVVAPHSDDVETQLDPRHCLPGWVPDRTLRYGVASAVDWYEQHGVGETYTHLKVGT
jgi:UDP-glucose 4-epimerase